MAISASASAAASVSMCAASLSSASDEATMPKTISSAIRPSSSPSAIRRRPADASAGAWECPGPWSWWCGVGRFPGSVKTRMMRRRGCRYVHSLATNPSHARQALMGLMFFPRGGSAHVARSLARALPATGWHTSILTGSISVDDTFGDAARFYRGLDVRALDMTRALHAPDPMAADPPLHPSYEDRADAPDRILASLDAAEAELQVTAWAKALQSAGAAHADVLHLHHLTPLYEAARRVAPGVPVVGHLHGTELLMLEAIEHDAQRWPYGADWAERLRAWAEQAYRLIVLTETACDRAAQL